MDNSRDICNAAKRSRGYWWLTGHYPLRLQRWCLNHPSRVTWIVCELLRPLPFRQKMSNCWWQFRHFGDHEAFDALWQTWSRSHD